MKKLDTKQNGMSKKSLVGDCKMFLGIGNLSLKYLFPVWLHDR